MRPVAWHQVPRLCTVPACIRDATTRTDSQPYPKGRRGTLLTTSLPLIWRDHPKGLQWLQRICLEPKGKGIQIVLFKSLITPQSVKALSYAVRFSWHHLEIGYLKYRFQIHGETLTENISTRSGHQVTSPNPFFQVESTVGFQEACLLKKVQGSYSQVDQDGKALESRTDTSLSKQPPPVSTALELTGPHFNCESSGHVQVSTVQVKTTWAKKNGPVSVTGAIPSCCHRQPSIL